MICSRQASREMRSLRSRWRSEVARNVWMRLRSAGSRARAASSMSAWRRPRERRDDRPAHLAGDLSSRLGIGRRRDGEPGLDDVHAQRIERPRHDQLRRHVHREARGLLAVPERGVEDDDLRGVLTHGVSCSVPAPRSQSDNYYGKITIIYGPHSAAHLPGGRRRAELLAGRGQSASDPTGRQPGGPAARSRSGRAAVRPFVEERDADRRRTRRCRTTASGSCVWRRKPSRPCASCATCAAAACSSAPTKRPCTRCCR